MSRVIALDAPLRAPFSGEAHLMHQNLLTCDLKNRNLMERMK
jgi:hypothetical protein